MEHNDEDFLTQPDLERRYRKNRTTLWRWLRQGVLPQPDLHLNGRNLWKRSSIEQFERAHVPRTEGAQS